MGELFTLRKGGPEKRRECRWKCLVEIVYLSIVLCVEMGTRKERLLQKLDPVLLKMTPRLSADTGSFIDLDSNGSLEEGAKNLMMRFFRNQDLCEKNKRNPVENESEVTITSAKFNDKEEICELITEKLSLPVERNDHTDLFERPGRRLQKLKMELQEKMSAKWEEDYRKRVSESESLIRKSKKNKKGQGDSDKHSCDTQDENENDRKVDEGENSDAGDEADVESEGEENEHEVPVCDEEENFGSKDSGKDCEYDDSEACSLVPAYQPGGGLLYGGSELTQGEEELPQNLLSPSLRLSVNESPASKTELEFQEFADGTPKKSKAMLNGDGESTFAVKSKLFSQNPNSSFDLNDAFEFCSGKFPDGDQLDTEKASEEKLDGEGDEEDEEEKESENEFEEGSESGTEKEMPKTRKNIITLEDSEEEEESEKKTEEKEGSEAEETVAGVAELLSDEEEEGGRRGRQRTNKVKLCYSDEEDSGDGWREEAKGGEEEGEGLEEEEEEEGCERRSVHYDSEENEILNPKEFFEREAELSGSECSGDEDERGLDELEVEEGDADMLDNDVVRSQLEKIHIRHLRDDDDRNVRMLQELLLEHGDLHSDGEGRGRHFRWGNLGTFEETGGDGGANEEGGSSSEDDCAEEEEQRKLRYEKELFLMTKKKNEEDGSDEELLSGMQLVKVARTEASALEDRGAGKSKTMAELTKAVSCSLGSSGRGSFLARNEEFLSRLAKATSGVSDNVSGPKHSRNFVFASRSPEKAEGSGGCKRQVEESGSVGREEKRRKVAPAEVDTGPSILDLLA